MSTLKEVAALAGVSPATVSLALNGKPVNEETRRLVISCAKQLNYVPNRIGRTLITGKTHTILMVILNSTRYTNLVVDTTFFYNYIEGVLESAGKLGYSVTFDVRNWEDPDLEDYFYQKVHGKSVDGIIIIPQYERPMPFLNILDGFPFVILNSHIQDEKIASFRVDNYLGGRLVALYMQKCGYKSIAFINGPEEHYDASERKRGFFDVFQITNETNTDIIEDSGDWTIRCGFEAAERIFAEKQVDAVFCGNDFMASGVLRYLCKQGLRVPEDVSLIGYDNMGLAKAIYPRLTTVDGRLPEIGFGLGEMLLSHIEGTAVKEPSEPLKPKLIIRESSRPTD
jgi:DNA-binding LacI/PurR family transcriptional regulator